jgi:hypothetical protein
VSLHTILPSVLGAYAHAGMRISLRHVASARSLRIVPLRARPYVRGVTGVGHTLVRVRVRGMSASSGYGGHDCEGEVGERRCGADGMWRARRRVGRPRRQTPKRRGEGAEHQARARAPSSSITTSRRYEHDEHIRSSIVDVYVGAAGRRVSMLMRRSIRAEFRSTRRGATRRAALSRKRCAEGRAAQARTYRTLQAQ